jgi:RNA polymerase sigma factor (sigma-70 family)
MRNSGDKYGDALDEKLVHMILAGNKEALHALIDRHKDWIFNIAVGMTGNAHEAEDVTQEILLKIVTKLSTFKFKSSFKTWLYRIAVNQVMSMKKKGKEGLFSSFEKHRNILDALPDQELGEISPAERRLLVEETRVECLLGMLLCLNRKQRIVFVLAGIFGIDSALGAEFLEISEMNFRKRLSRARIELRNFLSDNCSLMDSRNSCRCARKTKAAIEKGYVDPDNLQYSAEHVLRVRERVENLDLKVDDMIDLRVQKLFQDNPYKIFNTKEFAELMGSWN